jgi:hypothetical protein
MSDNEYGWDENSDGSDGFCFDASGVPHRIVRNDEDWETYMREFLQVSYELVMEHFASQGLPIGDLFEVNRLECNGLAEWTAFWRKHSSGRLPSC